MSHRLSVIRTFVCFEIALSHHSITHNSNINYNNSNFTTDFLEKAPIEEKSFFAFTSETRIGCFTYTRPHGNRTMLYCIGLNQSCQKDSRYATLPAIFSRMILLKSRGMGMGEWLLCALNFRDFRLFPDRVVPSHVSIIVILGKFCTFFRKRPNVKQKYCLFLLIPIYLF